MARGAWREAAGAPLDGPFLRQLLMQLDAGEAAAIALAVERKASLLLMDDYLADVLLRVQTHPVDRIDELLPNRRAPPVPIAAAA